MNGHSGTYALILEATRHAGIQIGRLGRLAIRPGFYIYVGSAFGPGGLRARVGWHCHGATRRRWHIDYLRAAVPIGEVWYSYDPERRERIWAETFTQMPGLSVPMPGFGASDHRGASHLFFSSESPFLSRFARQLYAQCDRHETIHRHCVRSSYPR